MTLLWAADLTRADSNAAGCADTPWERQTAQGNGDNSGLAWPVPIAPAPDGVRSLRFDLPSNGRRYEVHPDHAQFYGGEDYYFGTSFYLPVGFDAVADAGSDYQVIEQMRQADSGGSPGVAFEVRKGGLLLTGGYGVAGASPADQWAYEVVVLPEIATGRRYHLTYRMNFSTSPGQSWIDVWVDGEQHVADFNVPPPTVIGGGTYRKNGWYRDPANLTASTIWHADQRFGTTFADVDTTPPPIPDGPVIRETVAANASVADATVTTTSATKVGDVLVAFHANDYDLASNMQAPTPGTWTLRADPDRGTNLPHMKVWTREVTAAGAQTVTANYGTNSDVCLVVVTLDGSTVHPTAWFDGAANGLATATSTDHVCPSVTPTGAASLLLAACSTSATTDYTPPPGMVELAERDSGAYTTLAVFAEQLTAPGATGGRRATSSNSLQYAAATLAIREADAVPVTTTAAAQRGAAFFAAP